MFGRSPFSSGEDDAGRASEPLFRNGAGGVGVGVSAPPRASQPSSTGPLPEPAAAVAPRPAANLSTVSAAFRLEGDLVGDADLQLDGHVKGDVRAARLVIGPGGRVEGSVRAQHVEVRGAVVGSIEAQSVVLHESARVVGDVTPGRLSIEGGAHFEGRVQPLRQAAAPPAAPEAPRLRAVEPASSAGATAV